MLTINSIRVNPLFFSIFIAFGYEIFSRFKNYAKFEF